MSVNFPGNPWADTHSMVNRETAGVMTALNTLSFEQRTANLVNLFGTLIQANRPIPTGLYDQITTRLGIEGEE